MNKKGLPFYKDPMGHGNLYVVFKVDFPKKGELNQNQIDELKKILPGQVCPPINKSEPVVFLEPLHEADANPNPSGGKGRPLRQSMLICIRTRGGIGRRGRWNAAWGSKSPMSTAIRGSHLNAPHIDGLELSMCLNLKLVDVTAESSKMNEDQ